MKSHEKPKQEFFLHTRTQKLLWGMPGLRQSPSSAKRARRTPQYVFAFCNRPGPPSPSGRPGPAPVKPWAPRDPAAGHLHAPQLSPSVIAEFWPGACLSGLSNDSVNKKLQKPVSVTFEQPLYSASAGRGARTCGRCCSRHWTRWPPDHARHTLRSQGAPVKMTSRRQQ